jgi:hypothetical protein
MILSERKRKSEWDQSRGKKIRFRVEFRPSHATTWWNEQFSIKREVTDMKFICLGFQPARNAATVRWRSGNVVVTDTRVT